VLGADFWRLAFGLWLENRGCIKKDVKYCDSENATSSSQTQCLAASSQPLTS